MGWGDRVAAHGGMCERAGALQAKLQVRDGMFYLNLSVEVAQTYHFAAVEHVKIDGLGITVIETREVQGLVVTRVERARVAASEVRVRVDVAPTVVAGPDIHHLKP